MENTQTTISDNAVVQDETTKNAAALNSDVLKDTCEFKQVNKDSTLLDMVKKIIPLAEKGTQLTADNENLTQLFKGIYDSCTLELLPAVEKLKDSETSTDDLKKAGDILSKIINYSDKGFQLTDLTEEDNLEKNFSEEHSLFAEILVITDTEIRIYIPTPVEE